MKKRAGGETVKPWRNRTDVPPAAALGKRLEGWALYVKPTAEDYDNWPELPDGVEDRDADCWEPLIVVAELAGGRWPEMARAAAVALVADKHAGADSLGVLLLTDIRRIFDTGIGVGETASKHAAIKTPTLLQELARIEESPWRGIKRDGSSLDARGLAMRLKPYGITSHDIRWPDGSVSKGFARHEFEDAWTRYITVASATEIASATDGEAVTCTDADVADVADFRSKRERGVARAAVTHHTKKRYLLVALSK